MEKGKFQKHMHYKIHFANLRLKKPSHLSGTIVRDTHYVFTQIVKNFIFFISAEGEIVDFDACVSSVLKEI